VGFADKLSNTARKLRGRVLRNAGKATGNRKLQAEGRAEEIGGSVRQGAEKIKDAFRGLRTRRHH
jgi:uncharacterized protein YjbJ (UPF0337 family)